MVRAIKDIGERQDKIVEWLNAVNKKLTLVDNVLGAYVEYEGNTKNLQEYLREVDEKRKKAEAEARDKISDEEE